MCQIEERKVCLFLPRDGNFWLQCSYLEKDNERISSLHMDQLQLEQWEYISFSLEPFGYRTLRKIIDQSWDYFQWKFIQFFGTTRSKFKTQNPFASEQKKKNPLNG
jgi:hypothetical protein